MADNEEFLTCPACGKNMVKAFIQSANKHVDICLEGCGGIFFDNRELELFDEKHENVDEIMTFYNDGREFLRVSDMKRECPVCHVPMHKIGNGTKNNSFQIDHCYTCGGKFLDFGELEKIRQAAKFEPIQTSSKNAEVTNMLNKETEKKLKTKNLLGAGNITEGIVDIIMHLF